MKKQTSKSKKPGVPLSGSLALIVYIVSGLANAAELEMEDLKFGCLNLTDRPPQSRT